MIPDNHKKSGHLTKGVCLNQKYGIELKIGFEFLSFEIIDIR